MANASEKAERPTKSKFVYARIEPELQAEIERIAREEDRTISYVVRRLLTEALGERR